MATTGLPQIDYSRFSKHGDLMLAAGVVGILFVMLVPLPTFFLDIMLCVSISISLLVLVTTMFMTSPLEFTIFPSLLLVTTLLRLALNVASTRLILLNGDMGAEAAGSVIRSFGEFVVGGSYVVGGVIFMIMFILNKSVITAGTTRIAEVAARFTLDPANRWPSRPTSTPGSLTRKRPTTAATPCARRPTSTAPWTARANSFPAT